MIRKTGLAAIVALLVGGTSATAAILQLPTTFTFKGACTDCFQGNGFGTATLVLNNYVAGSAIDSSNFVSFSYDGTDLLSAFTITASQASSLSGRMTGPFPATENFFITGNGQIFLSNISGAWCVGGACLADYGPASSWSQAAAVPEPASWALMVAGFGLVGMAVRRHPKVVTRISYDG